MTGGSAEEFVDALSLGIEKEFSFRGRTLFAQGGGADGTWQMTVAQWDPPEDDHLWSTEAGTMRECFERFLEAPIFDGKTFWQVESELEWISG